MNANASKQPNRSPENPCSGDALAAAAASLRCIYGKFND